jgi:hypothetical protein
MGPSPCLQHGPAREECSSYRIECRGIFEQAKKGGHSDASR